MLFAIKDAIRLLENAGYRITVPDSVNPKKLSGLSKAELISLLIAARPNRDIGDKNYREYLKKPTSKLDAQKII